MIVPAAHHPHVARFRMDEPVKKLSLLIDADTDSRSDCHIYDNSAALSRAVYGLAESRSVHVRVKGYGNVKGIPEGRQEIHVLPAVLGCVHHKSVGRRTAVQVQRAERGHSQRSDRMLPEPFRQPGNHNFRPFRRKFCRFPDFQLSVFIFSRTADNFCAACFNAAEYHKCFPFFPEIVCSETVPSVLSSSSSSVTGMPRAAMRRARRPMPGTLVPVKDPS